MAFATPGSQPGLSPSELRCLTGRRVKVETTHGMVGGQVLSCTRRSLWLVDTDDDIVVPLDEIIAVSAS